MNVVKINKLCSLAGQTGLRAARWMRFGIVWGRQKCVAVGNPASSASNACVATFARVFLLLSGSFPVPQSLPLPRAIPILSEERSSG